MQSYADWFCKVTGKPPFPYQEGLAIADDWPLVLSAPTGAGKTAAVVVAWLWKCFCESSRRASTPRRLVYCLPMRTLVEQTYSAIEKWLENAELQQEVGLHLLMGGAVSHRWDDKPEQHCILVGTQDQLVSRALNRGYAMSRNKWPIHFALLNNDCLWVMDEVQLMGAALRTTAQLQGLREKFGTYGMTRSLWMSATLDPDLLVTADHKPGSICVYELTSADLDGKAKTLVARVNAQKPLRRAETVCASKGDQYGDKLAQEIAAAHHPGSLTLVICNRVARAQEVYEALKKYTAEPRTLIHSRFRAAERQSLNAQLREGLSGILVATQAIEAGVDISAQVLFTELAPWSSMVQRFGRCNRYGEHLTGAAVYWIDIPDLTNKSTALPYDEESLKKARSLLAVLQEVSPNTLKAVTASPPKIEGLVLQQRDLVQPIEGLVPRRHDLLQLFDTSTDLAGHDIDVSSFIREANETDVAIAWRKWDGSSPPANLDALQAPELCRVSLSMAGDFLKEIKKQKQAAWVRDGRKKWQEVKTLVPGMTILVPCQVGGYDPRLGFTGKVGHTPAVPIEKAIEADQDERDLLSQGATAFVELSQHSLEVKAEIETLIQHFSDWELPAQSLSRAAHWHDSGKAHPFFQTRLTHNREAQQGETLWAKSDHDFKDPADRYLAPDDRQGFRHELVSALLALQEQESFLLCYLVACHHGRARMSIQPRLIARTQAVKKPDPEQRAAALRDSLVLSALGVHEGDRVHHQLPEIDLGGGLVIPSQDLSLECLRFGESDTGPSWTARALDLLEEYGPFKLAFLETLVRIADWRGSAKHAVE